MPEPARPRPQGQRVRRLAQLERRPQVGDRNPHVERALAQVGRVPHQQPEVRGRRHAAAVGKGGADQLQPDPQHVGAHAMRVGRPRREVQGREAARRVAAGVIGGLRGLGDVEDARSQGPVAAQRASVRRRALVGGLQERRIAHRDLGGRLRLESAQRRRGLEERLRAPSRSGLDAAHRGRASAHRRVQERGGGGPGGLRREGSLRQKPGAGRRRQQDERQDVTRLQTGQTGPRRAGCSSAASAFTGAGSGALKISPGSKTIVLSGTGEV